MSTNFTAQLYGSILRIYDYQSITLAAAAVTAATLSNSSINHKRCQRYKILFVLDFFFLYLKSKCWCFFHQQLFFLVISFLCVSPFVWLLLVRKCTHLKYHKQRIYRQWLLNTDAHMPKHGYDKDKASTHTHTHTHTESVDRCVICQMS